MMHTVVEKIELDHLGGMMPSTRFFTYFSIGLFLIYMSKDSFTRFPIGFCFSPNMLPSIRGSYLALRIAFLGPLPSDPLYPLYPLSLIPYPSPLTHSPLSLVPYPLSFIPYPTSLILCPLFCIPYSLHLTPYPLSIIPYALTQNHYAHIHYPLCPYPLSVA